MRNSKTYIFLIALCVFLIMSGVVWYMHMQIQNKIERVQEYYAQEEKNSNFEFGKNLENRLSIIKEQEEDIKDLFLKGDSLISFVSQLERFASDYGVEMVIEKVNQDKPVSINEEYLVNKIDFYINLKSSNFDAIKKFVTQAQKVDELMAIEELKIYRLNSEQDGVNYNVRLILSGNALNYAKN